MPSTAAFKKLAKKGIIDPKDPYARYDTLATNSDWEYLLNILADVRDSQQKGAILTVNFIVCNPDFRKIAASKFKSYYCEPLEQSLLAYEERDQYFSMVRKGIGEHLLCPQLHGREHVNVERWMSRLRESDPHYIESFHHSTFFVGRNKQNFNGKSIFAALDYDQVEDLIKHQDIINDAADEFNRIFGFRSESFIAPNYVWNDKHEDLLQKAGVRYIQGSKFRNDPLENSPSYNRKSRKIGSLNGKGLVNLVRNCFFEPSNTASKDIVTSCLLDISRAFRWNRPAVISTHRLNYIGALDTANRDRNLQLLDQLLKGIVGKWPEVEFMSSAELGKLIRETTSLRVLSQK